VPCSVLVQQFVARAAGCSVNESASVNMGSVLVMHMLKECVRLHKVGRNIIPELNLTSMMTSMSAAQDCCSHAFMSASDFVSVVSKNKGVGLQMLEQLPLLLTQWRRARACTWA
jgi:hypothetical protein